MFLSSEQTFKGSAIFMAVFGLQFLIAPAFLMSQNFQEGSYELDKWHNFTMRGCGAAFLGVTTFYWNTAHDADRYMKGATLSFFLTAVVLPWNAQLNLPVKMPMHLVPTLGCLYLGACHVHCLIQATAKSKAS